MAQSIAAGQTFGSGAEQRLAAFGRWLMQASALTGSSRANNNMLQGYSGLMSAALDRTARRIGGPAMVGRPDHRVGVLAGIDWVKEAYRRLEGLITGEFKPGSPQQARQFFRDAKISVEQHTIASGKSASYLRDDISGRTTPAARVSPRLSDPNLNRMLGRDKKADLAQANELVAAKTFRDALERVGNLRVETVQGRPPYEDWKTMQFSVGATLTHLVATNPHGLSVAYGAIGVPAAGGALQGMFGLQVDLCESTPEKTWASMRRQAVALGLPLPGPVDAPLDEKMRAALAQHFATDPAMPEGTPILLRDANLVPAAMIHPALALSKIEDAIRAESARKIQQAEQALKIAVSKEEREPLLRRIEDANKAAALADFKAAMSEGAPKGRSADVLSIADLRRMKANRLAEINQVNEPIVGFDTVGPAKQGPGSVSPDNVIIRFTDNGIPEMFIQRRPGDDPELFQGKAERPLIEVMKVGDLPAGRYKVENSFEMPDGEMLVTQDGRTRHIAPEPDEIPAPTADQEPNEPNTGFGYSDGDGSGFGERFAR